MMGTLCSTSQPQSQPDPSGIEKLNDSVYELYKPPSPRPSVLVIFFHGLEEELHYKNAYWKTWLSRDRTVVWPMAWLSTGLSEARILSLSYDSAAQRDHNGSSDTYNIAENLISDIILSAVNGGQNCPVVLVGHCLGGLIIKEFLLGCINKSALLRKNASTSAKQTVERIDKFLENCGGVFYYATPHQGTRIGDYLAQTGIARLNEPVIALLKTLNTRTSRINEDFRIGAINGEQIRTGAIGETLPTTYMDFSGILVEEASARGHLTDGFYTIPASNHFDVCKARNNEWCNIYNKLRKFVQSVVEDHSGTKGEGSGAKAHVKSGVMTLQHLGL